MKNYYFLLGLLLSSTSLFSQPFWSEDFSGGSFPAGWTSEDESTVGVEWDYCTAVENCPPFKQQFVHEGADLDVDFFRSKTGRDGYLYANPTTQGTSAVPFNVHLTTPPIDCSSQNQVVLSFSNLLIYQFNTPATSAFLQVKNENSDFQTYEILPTWDEGTPALPSIPTWNGKPIYVDISAMAAGFSEVEIRWLWQGQNEYVWAIDDVELFNYHPLYERAIWGTNEGEGDFSGGLNDWQSIGVQSSCAWGWNEKGWVDNFFPQQNDYVSICSHTPDNGAATLNATVCVDNQEPVQTISHLISPPIDLSMTNATAISLQFFQQVEIGTSDNPLDPLTTLSWTTDGNLWSPPINVNPLAEFQNIECNEKRIALPNELIGESEVQFRFTFRGSLFYWIIDDVRVMENAAFDLKLKENFYAIAPNYSTPKSQLDSFNFLVDIENIGTVTQTEVEVKASIQDWSTNEVFYEDVKSFSTIDALELVENQLFDATVPMPIEEGRYYGKYEISSVEADENQRNDCLEFEFEISENTFAKERGFRTGFAPDGVATYEMGNCFYIPNGEGFYASEITFGFAAYASFQGAQLQLNIYKWNISSPQDSIAEESELEILGAATYTNIFNGAGLQTITKTIDPLDGEKILLEDDSYYLVTVSYSGMFGCNGVCPFFIGASDEFNYAPNYFLTRNLTNNPRFASVFRPSNEQDFNTIGFNLKRMPVVRLHIEPLDVSTIEMDQNNNSLILFPNPAQDEIFLDLKNVALTENTQISIYNTQGIRLTSQRVVPSHSDQLSVRLDELNSGMYILQLINNQGQLYSNCFVKH